MIVVYRYINDISLNGKEWLLNKDGDLALFNNEQEVLDLLGHKDLEEMEKQGMYIEEKE